MTRRDRWLNYPKVNEAAGWILRHSDYEDRPWILVINGYRTGDLGTDLMSFRVKHLHKGLGSQCGQCDVAVTWPPRTW